MGTRTCWLRTGVQVQLLPLPPQRGPRAEVREGHASLRSAVKGARPRREGVGHSWQVQAAGSGQGPWGEVGGMCHTAQPHGLCRGHLRPGGSLSLLPCHLLARPCTGWLCAGAGLVWAAWPKGRGAGAPQGLVSRGRWDEDRAQGSQL